MIHIPGIDEVTLRGVVTKRDILHSIAKIFDPLGLITPVTFHGKTFLQKLWRIDQSWDEPLPNNLMKDWNQVAQIRTCTDPLFGVTSVYEKFEKRS